MSTENLDPLLQTFKGRIFRTKPNWQVISSSAVPWTRPNIVRRLVEPFQSSRSSWRPASGICAPTSSTCTGTLTKETSWASRCLERRRRRSCKSWSSTPSRPHRVPCRVSVDRVGLPSPPESGWSLETETLQRWSVIRFGDISPVWLYFKSLLVIFNGWCI